MATPLESSPDGLAGCIDDGNLSRFAVAVNSSSTHAALRPLSVPRGIPANCSSSEHSVYPGTRQRSSSPQRLPTCQKKGKRSRDCSLESAATFVGSPSPRNVLEELTPRGSEISADEPRDCCLCLEPITFSAINVLNLDISQHDAMNAAMEQPNICLIRESTCADCLMHILNKYEQDYKKDEKGYPCPLCKIPLREITQENMALRAVARFKDQSPAFRADCDTLNSVVHEAENQNDVARAQMHKRARDLVRSLARRDKTRTDELAPIKEFKSAPWCREALKTYKADKSAFQSARANYRQLWPKESDAQRSERQRVRIEESGWQTYDPAKWECATEQSTDM